MSKAEEPVTKQEYAGSAERGDETYSRLRRNRRRIFHILSVLLLMIVLSFLAVIANAYFDGEFRTVDGLQLYIDRYGVYGPVFLTVLQAVQVVIPVLPGFFGCAVGAVMFGPVVGFWCNYIGISAGSVIAFFLARRYGMPLLDDLFPKGKYSKWAHWASRSRSYTAFLFMAMLLPLFPDDYLCYLTGVSRMSAKKFLWIIILGKPWCILAYSYGFSLIG